MSQDIIQGNFLSFLELCNAILFVWGSSPVHQKGIFLRVPNHIISAFERIEILVEFSCFSQTDILLGSQHLSVCVLPGVTAGDNCCSFPPPPPSPALPGHVSVFVSVFLSVFVSVFVSVLLFVFVFVSVFVSEF